MAFPNTFFPGVLFSWGGPGVHSSVKPAHPHTSFEFLYRTKSLPVSILSEFLKAGSLSNTGRLPSFSVPLADSHIWFLLGSVILSQAATLNESLLVFQNPLRSNRPSLWFVSQTSGIGSTRGLSQAKAQSCACGAGFLQLFRGIWTSVTDSSWITRTRLLSRRCSRSRLENANAKPNICPASAKRRCDSMLRCAGLG